ncbi:hypothetical protein PIROE2DRAFT_5029 [Piromyces sp. E2]|nr:hypothetical protein PIROE2DRAFT_5029 [Piromyces sp. E2]|eukprot:OUM67502.1 hypothetical protein PIROE2DRAFT_5029 [Piromyces sp. E2]
MYGKKNKNLIGKVNNYIYDLLIYAIEEKASNESQIKTNFYQTPPLPAIKKNNFKIANLLLEKRANIDFDVKSMVPFKTKVSTCDFQKFISNEKRKLFIDKIIDFSLKYCIKRDDGEEILNSIHCYFDNEKSGSLVKLP